MVQYSSIVNRILLFALPFFLTGCNEVEQSITEQTYKAQTKHLISIGKVNLSLELAILEKERTQGLMFRETLTVGEGMLFVFKKPQRQRFWMKNTRIPLDIGYFSTDGYLKEIHSAKPYDLRARRS